MVEPAVTRTPETIGFGASNVDYFVSTSRNVREDVGQ
jgi:hypothetical protein